MLVHILQKNIEQHTYHQNGVHHLGDVKCVSPVVVENGTVVLSYAENPLAKYLVVDVKAFNEIEIEEHSNDSSDHLVFR